MKIDNEIKLDFSDVLLRPKRSTLNSRNEVVLEREFNFLHSNSSWKGIPIMVSNMDTVGTIPMLKATSEFNILTCLHKYININDLINAVKDDNKIVNNSVLSTGISDNDWANLTMKIDLLEKENINIKFICVDVANGYMISLIKFCKRVRKKYPNKILIAGNVVTREVVEELVINGGVDIVKVGIGSGSVCTTRLQTGVGMPQLSAVLECADAAHGVGAHIISDGGIVVPGDMSKGFGGGADFIMSGSMFSGHDESTGNIIEEDEKKYKIFYGMSSDTAMNKYNGGVAKYRSSEGKTVKVLYKGPVKNTINSILGGIRSTCTYVGAKRLKDLPKCATFLRVNNQVNTKYN
uniref:GMP reductase n=1 Tax=viral metagenome TaxID=1070528 RepID=A0A6C0IYA3_9ZZZZ